MLPCKPVSRATAAESEPKSARIFGVRCLRLEPLATRQSRRQAGAADGEKKQGNQVQNGSAHERTPSVITKVRAGGFRVLPGPKVAKFGFARPGSRARTPKHAVRHRPRRPEFDWANSSSNSPDSFRCTVYHPLSPREPRPFLGNQPPDLLHELGRSHVLGLFLASAA